MFLGREGGKKEELDVSQSGGDEERGLSDWKRSRRVLVNDLANP